MIPSANTANNGKQFVRHRRAVLGVLLAAIIVVFSRKYVALLVPGYQGYMLLSFFPLMVAVPYCLARIMPNVAGFDNQWRPSARSHWLWFLGMMLLLLAVEKLAIWLMSFHDDWFFMIFMSNIVTDVKPSAVVFGGVFFVLLVPVAEEIFWRGYLLEQLRKLTHWKVALLIQSSLFSLAHLPRFWPSLPYIFVVGTILGIWRIRFRSLLPIILAHIIINGVVSLPSLKTQYDASVKSYPKCREIDLLTSKPIEKAVPALIRFASDPDKVVSAHALSVLTNDYRSKAVPYLKVALASGDKRTVDSALAAVTLCPYPDLRQQVQKIAWSFDDQNIQAMALIALGTYEDQEGLQSIAQRHPDENIRRMAKQVLGISSTESQD